MFAMDKISVEQRVCLKFCVANGISCADSLKMLEKCYGESVISKTRTYEWYKTFKKGREIVEDMPRSGRPSTSKSEENIEKVKKIVHDNRKSSLREIARELNISHESVRSILVNDLGMKHVADRIGPAEKPGVPRSRRQARPTGGKLKGAAANSIAEDRVSCDRVLVVSNNYNIYTLFS